MPPIAIEWTAQSHIRSEAVSLAAPLLEAIALRAVAIRTRVQQTGMSGEGQRFRPYTELGIKRRKREGLQVAFKDYTATGTFWRSMKAKLQSPTRATVVFTGKVAAGKRAAWRRTKKGQLVLRTNAALARILNRSESSSLLLPTEAEIQELGQFVADRLTTEIVTAQSLEESAFLLARRTRSAQRKAKQAIKALRGQSG